MGGGYEKIWKKTGDRVKHDDSLSSEDQGKIQGRCVERKMKNDVLELQVGSIPRVAKSTSAVLPLTTDKKKKKELRNTVIANNYKSQVPLGQATPLG